ncbi:beta-galactosidase [Mucilaginibacter galii]|uniref:Beta-galactosidase n=1 Tax=Mucilaginibacter galii TaxID=2005073 RepID=A0A917N3C4_9SPHI|nr:beta-galactosidase GalA [Mucilaginibacter galii]GGI52788.1 beta-galactosidase [Mucilaginibacter galii]
MLVAFKVSAQTKVPPREHLLMDFGWRFAFGHPFDTNKDFGNATGYFSYLAKTGYGDGAAAADFDDRSWRKLNLPHDWAVEQPFSEKASYSHGFKAIGRNFPDASIGWYRKTFTIPASDEGRQISVAFDGVYRNAIVWINGHYLGTNASGYLGFEYNISSYLNYGGENVIAVRADATMEEGWFYEGAGIYRHVWLNKTNLLHVATEGTFVTATVRPGVAVVKIKADVINEGNARQSIIIKQTVVNAEGKAVASSTGKSVYLSSLQNKEVADSIVIPNPQLWSIEKPYLYKVLTEVSSGGIIEDKYETTFGIRTIRFDANEGFFLNGKHIKIKGTNNHQDHAGVGSAMPDALQDFRIKALKSMGANAYRCSHNPPTPELLEACDRLGMLVIDENRLMGTASTELGDMKRLMMRDRNHPSVISWSIGNEEWGIEGNITGARIAATMQQYVKSLDTTRFVTAAVSGGWGNGISTTIDVMGYNYITHGSTDEQHHKFPSQRSWGTEEGSTHASRGIYFTDKAKQQIAAYDRRPNQDFVSIEDGWKHYAQRPYLAGMFIWTGFDYRGEPTPYQWPSTGSYFGMLDQCGFPKDNVYYLRSWWTYLPTLHLLPHWNWMGKEGQMIPVWAYSNCTEVELFLNKRSLGKKSMPVNGHLEWQVAYQPGQLEAVGYRDGKIFLRDVVKSTGSATQVDLQSDKTSLIANNRDVAILTVDVKDKNKLHVPDADNEVRFSVTGPGKIIGVGNGDPTSHEPDQYIETIRTASINNLRERNIESIDIPAATIAAYPETDFSPAFQQDRNKEFAASVKALAYRGSFELPQNLDQATIRFFYRSIGKQQTIYINGKQITANTAYSKKGNTFVLDKTVIKPGKNTITIIAVPLTKQNSWDIINMDPGLIQLVNPAPVWKRKLFSGLAQVIVQSTGTSGDIIFTAAANGLKSKSFIIKSAPPKLLRAHVEE